MRKIPILPTIVVIAAVATMIALGVWQLQRKAWKEGLVARYAAISADAPPVAYPADAAGLEQALFRKSSFDCARVGTIGGIAGRSAEGEAGWVYLAKCTLPDGRSAEALLGWSKDIATPQWAGGPVAGTLTTHGRIVADPPLAGLAAQAQPDPGENLGTTPGGHLLYAVQWFIFATAAAAIYLIALRKRWRQR
ncbi:MAG: SURF1 family protein [Sphingomonadales bacterium]|nr:SURF1 family protein [Sphingomonadales bacterium]MBD3773382.1 SURF1 family protein [Paracoccaceae bacterium]